jgi:hypothetical protein
MKLASVASAILGVSGRALRAALVQGPTDPAGLADLARGRRRGKRPARRHALASRFRPHHAFVIGQLLAHLDDREDAITTLSAEIERGMAPWAEPLRPLDTIPGINQRTGGSHPGGGGRGQERLPPCAASRELGRARSAAPREWRQTQVRQDPDGQPMAAHGADRGGGRGEPGQAQRPASPLPPGAAATRAKESRRGGGARPVTRGSTTSSLTAPSIEQPVPTPTTVTLARASPGGPSRRLNARVTV